MTSLQGLRFGTSGIRGVFNRELDLKVAEDICFALGTVSESGGVIVGYDTRRVSKILADVFFSTLNYYGRDAVDLGVAPTPVVAFASRDLGLNGVSLTASHNPPEYSGVKMFDKTGMEIPREFEEKVEASFTVPKIRKVDNYGRVHRDRAIHLKYIERMVSRLPTGLRRLRVLVDCGNGATSYFTPRILGILGHRVVTINSHHSSQFPGRVLEPNADSLKEVSELMSHLDFDIGIAHDGDGDRVVLLDERGRVIPDQVLTSLALKIVTEKRRGIVVLSVNTSNSVEKVAEEEGCRVTRARLGKTFIKLKKTGGIFASEPSKVTNPDWGFWEDGIYVACQVIQHLSRRGEKLSEIVEKIPTHFNYQRNISLKKLNRDQLGKKVFNHYKDCEVDYLDGVKITFKDSSWVIFRISGTEPKIRVYVDSQSKDRAAELLNEGVRIIEGVDN